ncbi:inosine-uridine preferring nucleoside hydrolase isoform X2 [Ixodes scapularis]|uniref:inosine-uridine preferring nucleoside hydrolase isoform X2 n=1 Tax=Ixodes scapularis TaxID=6945 RepID=UPI001A9F6460|nr:inosine-uridine preferring nucleoside hydrolase isoform X2 [Ixodes scapularis]
MTEELVIVDTDVGVDDAMALLLALSNPSHCRVLAITCVAGNVDLPRVYTNTLRILNFCKQLQIPVYRGCERPLVQKGVTCPQCHGQDGLGGVAEQLPLPDNHAEEPCKHASAAMVELVRAHPGSVTLVALGPLSNVALAQRLDPGFLGALKRLVIMGGTFDARGNETAVGEFNFAWDPEAASVVLSEAECETKLLTFELCLQHTIDWAWYDRWVSGDSPKARLVKAVTECTKQRQRLELHQRGFSCCDMLAMAAALHPSLVTRCEAFPAWVELHGATTRGMLVVDRRPSIKWNHGRPPHVQFLLGFDVEALKELYEQMLR